MFRTYPLQTAVPTGTFCAFLLLGFGNLHSLPPPRVPPFPRPSTDAVLWIHLTPRDKSSFNRSSLKKFPTSTRPPRVLARSFPLIPAISIAGDSVQLLGFGLYSSLTLACNLYMVSVHRARVLPPASFRFPVAGRTITDIWKRPRAPGY